MLERYTQEVNRKCFALISEDSDLIWADLDSMPVQSDKEKWGNTLRNIADEYVFSARFALMRIIAARPDVQLLEEDHLEAGFQMILNGKILVLRDITMEHKVRYAHIRRNLH